MDQITSFFIGHIPDFVWGIAAFVVFVLILLKLALKPVIQALDAREAKIRNELLESEQAYQKAKQVKDDLERQLKEAERTIAAKMAEARKDAETYKAEMMEKGKAEIDAMRVRALREIEAARYGAVMAVRTQIAEVAAEVAGRILKETIDANRHAGFVDQAIHSFETRIKAAR